MIHKILPKNKANFLFIFIFFFFLKYDWDMNLSSPRHPAEVTPTRPTATLKKKKSILQADVQMNTWFLYTSQTCSVGYDRFWGSKISPQVIEFIHGLKVKHDWIVFALLPHLRWANIRVDFLQFCQCSKIKNQTQTCINIQELQVQNQVKKPRKIY